VIIAKLMYCGIPVAVITYKPGLHVEIQVTSEFVAEEINIDLKYSENAKLLGTWEAALDKYFNDGLFDSKGSSLPGEMRRMGTGRDHRTLFRQAAFALLKDLEPHGYEVRVEFT
jgi:hypothetical protein